MPWEIESCCHGTPWWHRTRSVLRPQNLFCSSHSSAWEQTCPSTWVTPLSLPAVDRSACHDPYDLLQPHRLICQTGRRTTHAVQRDRERNLRRTAVPPVRRGLCARDGSQALVHCGFSWLQLWQRSLQQSLNTPFIDVTERLHVLLDTVTQFCLFGLPTHQRATQRDHPFASHLSLGPQDPSQEGTNAESPCTERRPKHSRGRNRRHRPVTVRTLPQEECFA